MLERPHRNPPPAGRADESRLLPLTVAGFVCFVTAVALGYGGWLLFGTHERHEPERAARVTQTSTEQSAQPLATPEPTPPAVLAPAGELAVPGGEFSIGGEGTDLPLQRVLVKPLAVGETEVTNEQYREFLKATGHKAPAHWDDGEFPLGAANEPVTGVNWHDAVAYCRWLSEKLGATVRLPTEAEWELAARGKEALRYPWGPDWNDRAADSAENGGRVRAVKSFPANRSPFGAYDMAGNVWEWTADEARDENGDAKQKEGVTLRVIKGGSAKEEREFITALARYEMPADKSSAFLGFRYVVERAAPQEQGAASNDKR
ncbi:MAG TPA: SUMF1/EgtB/PvdO family nonheme iron enzyme [Pyrinomonadaceae bacterium]|nr:SUMF1/EgtB/PvdO family nonheme iron enzyme [Pyrinomonadaceae bacterium]